MTSAKLMALNDVWQTGRVSGLTLAESIADKKHLEFVAFRRHQNFALGDKMGGFDEQANLAIDAAIRASSSIGNALSRYAMFQKEAPPEPEVRHPGWGEW